MNKMMLLISLIILSILCAGFVSATTIIQITNTSIGLPVNVRNNYGFQLQPFNDSLIRYINFDTNYNNTVPVQDLALDKNPNTTTYTNGNSIISGSSCFSGNCWYQDGSDENQVSVEYSMGVSSPDLNFSNFNWTIMMRALSNTNSSDTVLISKDDGANVPILLYYHNNLKSIICKIGNSTNSTNSSRSTMVTNKMMFISCSFNSTHINLQVDNILNSTPIGTVPFPILTATTFTIGNDNNGKYWNGTIDEVMIFNRSLTNVEITALYNNQTVFYTQNGSFTSIVQNLTAVLASEGNTLNITTNYSCPTGTNCNLYNRFHNMSPEIQQNLTGWWDFNTLKGNDTYIDENTNKMFTNYGVYLLMYNTRNVSINTNSYFERGITMYYPNLSATYASPHGVAGQSDEIFNKYLNVTINNGSISQCLFFNITNINTSTSHRLYQLGSSYWIGIGAITGCTNNATHFCIGTSLNNGSAQNNYIGIPVVRPNEWNLVCTVKNFTDTDIIVYNSYYPNGYNKTKPTQNLTLSSGGYNGGVCTSGVQFIGINGSCDDFYLWDDYKTNSTFIQLWQQKYQWMNYSLPCNISVNSSGCLFNITGNFTQNKYEINTSNYSLTPIIYDYSYSIQNTSSDNLCDCPSGSNWVLNTVCTKNNFVCNLGLYNLSCVSGGSLVLLNYSNLSVSHAFTNVSRCVVADFSSRMVKS